MSYQLREGVFAAQAGEQVVLLDLMSNRYFGFSTVPAGQGDHDLSSIGSLTGPTAESLLARKLIADHDDHTSTASTRAHRIPSFDLRPPRQEAARPGLMALSAALQLRFQWQLRRKSLAYFKSRIEQERASIPSARPLGEPDYHGLTVSFDAVDALLPRADRCLARSLAYLRLCHLRGWCPTLVIGVQLRPFAAHCWIQDADVVLNDDLENVASFTPILTI